MKISIKDLIYDTQHNNVMVSVAIYFIVILKVIMLNVVMLSVIMLSVVAPLYSIKIHTVVMEQHISM
jgi:hypothetical protein